MKFAVCMTMCAIGLLCAITLSAASSTPDAVAVHALEGAGYSDVLIQDKRILFVSLLGCDRTDGIRWLATARGPDGRLTTVTVCAGVFVQEPVIRGLR